MSIIDKLRELFPANRVAAVVGFLTAIGAALVALETSFIPGSPAAEAIAKAAVMIAALAKAGAIVVKFLEGSQNFDSLLIAGVPKSGASTAQATAVGDLNETGPENTPVEPGGPSEEELKAQYAEDAPVYEDGATMPLGFNVKE